MGCALSYPCGMSVCWGVQCPYYRYDYQATVQYTFKTPLSQYTKEELLEEIKRRMNG